MESEADIAAVAGALASRSRTAMLNLLLDGRSHPAGDLAREAGIAVSTASGHLGELVDLRLVALHQAGRQRRYELAGPEVAHVLEALAAVAPRRAVTSLKGATDTERLRGGRTCYDHLAGRLGVTITEGLLSRRALRRSGDSFTLTRTGVQLFDELGIDLASARSRKRKLALACLDWTERRSHLGGALGAAMCEGFFALGWVRRVGSGRAVAATEDGARSLHAALGIELAARPTSPPRLTRP
jgi:DNA-binding transcriptional ArsR family regulator